MNQFTQQTQTQPQVQTVDILDLLFDYDRRKKDGVIQVEAIEQGKVKITVIQKHPFEADKEAGSISAIFSESQIEDITLDLDSKVIGIKKRWNESNRNFEAELQKVESQRSEVIEQIKKDIKTFSKQSKDETKK